MGYKAGADERLDQGKSPRAGPCRKAIAAGSGSHSGLEDATLTGVSVTEDDLASLGVSVEAASELRPALVREYSDGTLDCYQRRLAHYDQWCIATRLQAGPENITTAKVLDYVRAQIARWTKADVEPLDEAVDEGRRLRPETIKQAINALVYHGERSAASTPDDREAKELVRRFTTWYNAKYPPAWRVAGRRSPRKRRPPVARPVLPAATGPQGSLFDLDHTA